MHKMQIRMPDIDEILRKEDIEGYIGLGAPQDEYESEAEYIARALAELRRDQINQENVCAIISLIWQQRFDLSDLDMEQRSESISRAADQMLTSITD